MRAANRLGALLILVAVCISTGAVAELCTGDGVGHILDAGCSMLGETGSSFGGTGGGRVESLAKLPRSTSTLLCRDGCMDLIGKTQAESLRLGAVRLVSLITQVE